MRSRVFDTRFFGALALSAGLVLAAATGQSVFAQSKPAAVPDQVTIQPNATLPGAHTGGTNGGTVGAPSTLPASGVPASTESEGGEEILNGSPVRNRLAACPGFVRNPRLPVVPNAWPSRFSGSDFSPVNHPGFGVVEVFEPDEKKSLDEYESGLTILAEQINEAAATDGVRIIAAPTLPNPDLSGGLSEAGKASVQKINRAIQTALAAGKFIVTGSSYPSAPGIFTIGAASYFGTPSSDSRRGKNVQLYVAAGTESQAVVSFADHAASILQKRADLNFRGLGELFWQTGLVRGVGSTETREMNPLLAYAVLADSQSCLDCVVTNAADVQNSGRKAHKRDSCSQKEKVDAPACFATAVTRVTEHYSALGVRPAPEDSDANCESAERFFNDARQAYFLTGGAGKPARALQTFFQKNTPESWVEAQAFMAKGQAPATGTVTANAIVGDDASDRHFRREARVADQASRGVLPSAADNAVTKSPDVSAFLKVCSPYIVIDAHSDRPTDGSVEQSCRTNMIESGGLFRANLAIALIAKNQLIADPLLVDLMADEQPSPPDSEAYHRYRRILNLTARGWAAQASKNPPTFPAAADDDFALIMKHVDDIAIGARSAMLAAFKAVRDASLPGAASDPGSAGTPGAAPAQTSTAEKFTRGANGKLVVQTSTPPQTAPAPKPRPRVPAAWAEYFAGGSKTFEESFLDLASFGADDEEKAYRTGENHLNTHDNASPRAKDPQGDALMTDLIYDSRRIRARSELNPGLVSTDLQSLLTRAFALQHTQPTLADMQNAGVRDKLTDALYNLARPAFGQRPEVPVAIARVLASMPGSFIVLGKLADAPKILHELIAELDRFLGQAANGDRAIIAQLTSAFMRDLHTSKPACANVLCPLSYVPEVADMLTRTGLINSCLPARN